MLEMARHTFLSILRTKIFWVMLVFSILIISTVSYFTTREMINSNYSDYGRYDNERGSRDKMTREEIGEMQVPFPFGGGCSPGSTDIGREINTPLTAVFQFFGLMMLTFFSNLAGIFLMMGLIPFEISKRAIYTLVSKPLSRTDIYLGKMFGGWAAIFVFNFSLGFMFTVFLYLAGAPLVWKFLLIAVIGTLSPILFGTIAYVLGTFLGSVAVGFFSMVTLFFSTDAGNMIIGGIGKDLLKWDHLTDFVLLYLPPLARTKLLVIAFIDNAMVNGLTEMLIALDYTKVSSDWWGNFIFVSLYLAGVIFVGWAIFRSKEFN